MRMKILRYLITAASVKKEVDNTFLIQNGGNSRHGDENYLELV